MKMQQSHPRAARGEEYTKKQSAFALRMIHMLGTCMGCSRPAVAMHSRAHCQAPPEQLHTLERPKKETAQIGTQSHNLA